jgi:hypothetical protein
VIELDEADLAGKDLRKMIFSAQISAYKQ